MNMVSKSLFFMGSLSVSVACAMAGDDTRVIDILAVFTKHLNDHKPQEQELPESQRFVFPVTKLGVFQVAPDRSGNNVQFLACCRDKRFTRLLVFANALNTDGSLSSEWNMARSTIRTVTADNHLPFLEAVRGFKISFPRLYDKLQVPGKTMPTTTVYNNQEQAIDVTPLDYISGYGATKFEVSVPHEVQGWRWCTRPTYVDMDASCSFQGYPVYAVTRGLPEEKNEPQEVTPVSRSRKNSHSIKRESAIKQEQ